MECQLVGREHSNDGVVENTTPLYNMGKLFWQCLPYYMSIGMTPDEFFHGDVQLAVAYREAFKTKQRLRDEDAWMNGLYVYTAVLASAPRLNSIKPQKPNDYPDKPLLFRDPRTDDSQLDDIEAINFMERWAKKVNEKWEKQ